MEFTRRETLALGMGAVILTMLPLHADAATDDAITAFTGGSDVSDSGVILTAPELSENGASVPISVAAQGAVAIMVLATANPTPVVATFNFGPLSGASTASTRIRMAGTQDLIAVAKMADGSFAKATANVMVTVGGCSG